LERQYDVPPKFFHNNSFEELGIDPDEWWPIHGDRTRYWYYMWGTLKRILQPDEVSSEDVFIDFGCGTGRVLLEAADHYSFKRVIGIDVVPQLTELAEETLARNRHRLRCKEIEIVTQDALDYALPDDVTIAYFYEPFHGAILEAVLAKLTASVDRSPRRLRIVWVNRSGYGEDATMWRSDRVRFVRYGRRRLRRWRPAPFVKLYEIEPSTAGMRGEQTRT
jgi:SAM-dependent methyltransferase